MSVFNIVNAIVPSKKEKKEKSTIEIELFFSLFFDGLSSDSTQQNIRDAVRNGFDIPTASSENKQNLMYSICENPNAENSKSRNITNSLTRHFTINISLTPYNTIKNQYLNQLIKTKRFIENKVESYIANPEIESIKIYFYLIGYNQGEFIANIVNSIGIYDDDEKLSEVLKSFFQLKHFLDNKKIKSKIIESVTTIEPIGFVDTFVNNGFVKLVTGRSDLLYKQEDDNKTGVDYPSEENISIYDAVLMCQHTYYAEEAADKSIFSIIHSFFSKEEKKASKDGEVVSIQVDDDIFSNVQDNNKKINKNKPNWITTDAEWHSVSEKGSTVVEKCGIDLKCRITGFYSKLYERTENNKTISFAYCTAGTDLYSFNDWFFTNFLQGLTGISLQYTQSVRNAKKIDEYCKNKKLPLYFVGHSLGGGLASNNALVTSTRHAITFNAAGLHPFRIMATLLINNPKNFFNRTGRKNRVHPFIIDGEAVQLLRYIGQPAMSSEAQREKRFGNDTAIVNADIRKDKGGTLHFNNMGSIAKHNVLNFLRIKDLSQLKIGS
ncbi:hypothetical protein [Bacteroides xylanisolvens]|uniref:hypothetical protein n=1 Tax=Bacteroides xylanisolvens TaxID=371601 RepID=UPI0039B3B3D9